MIKPGMYISDRYEIIDKVGSGGMADVYKARCHRLNRFVAIKVLKSEFSDDKSFVSKFRGEAQSAAGLSHPNVVSVYDVGEDEGLYYIVMELVEGITLKNFIERKGKLEIKEAVGITIQIAQGMEAAHANHIIHRDIKPQNIIISREGKVKVADFGIAKAATSDTVTSNAMGSVHYISPEQARGGYSDEKSDIYSLGITLYEMLSGKVPFSGDNTVSVALQHIQQEAASLRELDPNIPIGIENIVRKCIQKKPERRYLNVSDLISDLKQSISNPNGDFVKIAPAVVDDSPTINISEEEVDMIKKSSIKSNAGTGPISTKVTNKEVEEYEDEDDEEEDEMEGDIDPKLEKLMIAGGVIMAVVLVIIIVFIIGKATGIFKFGGGKEEDPNTPGVEEIQDGELEDDTNTDGEEETEEPVVEKEPTIMPRFIGMTYAEARTELTTLETSLQPDIKLEFEILEAPSDLYEKDIISDQSISSGEEIKADTKVTLTVSTGAETVTVPDVYNRSDKEAETILTDAGFVVRHEYDDHDTVEKDKVIKTEPAKGASVKKGERVTIYISRGKKEVYVEVPNIADKTLEDAVKLLEANSLKKGTVTEKYSDTVEKGKVIHSDYSAGAKVKEGTEIGFTVSLGPEEKEYMYIGTVKLSNPFTEEGEGGTITLVLDQDGATTLFWEEYREYESNFPVTIPVDGTSTSKGTVTVLIDDVFYEEIIVNFDKVEK